MVEFIHTSDWHLGNPFSAFSEEQQVRLTEARFEGITRLFTYARSRGVRLLLAAGDQIDNGELRDTGVLLRLFGIISRFPEIQVVMIPGNHDPLSSGSIYSRVDEGSYPANLLFVRRPESLDLAGLGIRVLAAPLLERFGRVNPIVALAAESVPDEGVVTIGLAHGSLAVSDKVGGESDAFPVPPTLARDEGIDYLALGDWHSYLKSGDRTFYPGTHEALAFGDDCGSLHVRIAGAGKPPEAMRIDHSVMSWREVRRTLRDDSLEEFLLEWGGGDHGASDPDLGPLFSGSGGAANPGIGRVTSAAKGTATASDGEPATGVLSDDGSQTIVKLLIEGYLSLARFKQLDERLSVGEGRFFRVFRERLPEIRPSESELRDIAAEGYMKRVVERLIGLAADGDATADEALMRVYDFFHSRASGATS
jgi:hypothetical protein